MRIEHSQLHLAARHEQRVRQHTSITQRIGREQPSPDPASARGLLRPAPPAPTAPSTGTPPSPDRARAQEHGAACGADAVRNEPSLREPRLAVLARLVEAMTGLRVRVVRAEALQADRSIETPTATPATPALALEVTRLHVRHEQSTLQVWAQGQITLTDGRTLALDLKLELHHERLQVEAVTARAQRTKDPLMIALDTNPIGLSNWRFAFDLDADGQTEAVPFAAPGAGWLVLDRDGNGRIDDGREVLGALSGDGFADLAALDEDGNGWIDEADAAFEALRVWVRTGAHDPGRLLTLREAGVGALHTGRVASPWTLRTNDGAVAGLVRASGLYLAETGAARLLQQIDLVA